MKKLQDEIENIKYGHTLIVKWDKFSQKTNQYNGYTLLYDGSVFKDVRAVEVGDFFKILPNIAHQLELGYTYQLKYLSKEKKYESTITKRIRKGRSEEVYEDIIINNFNTVSDNFLDGIIALDTKIAQFNNKVKNIEIEKTKKIKVA